MCAHVVLLLPVNTGVAYTSECFPCRPGWFSSVPGSSSCQPCPSNTFSIKGTSSCTPCPNHHYSRTYTCNSMQLILSLVCLSLLLLVRHFSLQRSVCFLSVFSVLSKLSFLCVDQTCLLSGSVCCFICITVFCIITPPCPLFSTLLSDEGWAECKARPPCSEKDYFQIHTACDSEGKVSSVHTFYISHPRLFTAQGRTH